MQNPIGYFTNTFKTMVYNYTDDFKEIHSVAKRKANEHEGFTIFKQFIEG